MSKAMPTRISDWGDGELSCQKTKDDSQIECSWLGFFVRCLNEVECQ